MLDGMSIETYRKYMAKTIQLTKGAVALVSDCDFEMLSVRKWQINGAGYAQSKSMGASFRCIV